MRGVALSAGLGALFALTCAGCTVIGQTRQVHATQGRIDVKQHQLTEAEREQAELQQQMLSIKRELDARTVTSEELEHKLQKLRDANRRAATDNDRQQEKKRKLDAALSKDHDELEALRRNKTVDLAERQRRYDEIQADIKKQIDILSQIE